MTVVPSPGATRIGVNAPVIMDLLVIGLASPQWVPGGGTGEDQLALCPARTLPGRRSRGPRLADWHGRARPARNRTGRRPADPASPGAGISGRLGSHLTPAGSGDYNGLRPLRTAGKVGCQGAEN